MWTITKMPNKEEWMIHDEHKYLGSFIYEEEAIRACVAVNSDEAKVKALEAAKSWFFYGGPSPIVYQQICAALEQSGIDDEDMEE